MKKTLWIILIFAVLLAALLGAAELAELLQPEKETTEEPEEKKNVWETELNIPGATAITLAGEEIGVRGEGVYAADSVVTIVYPGTYSLSGTLTDGQIIIDSSNDGPIYLVLNGADITCSDGPAVFIKNAGSVELYLVPGTDNTLCDGASYATVLLEDGSEDPDQPDAALYSRDDLAISGAGCLTVSGMAANGIRGKDKMTVAEASITVNAAKDGIKASDKLTVESGSLFLSCADDGLCANKGSVSILGGEMNIGCYGDAVSAYTELEISGGSLTVRGSGDAMEAPVIRVRGGWLSLNAEDKALSAAVADLESDEKPSDCLLEISGGTVFAEAAVPVRSEGDFCMTDGAVFLTSSSAEDEPMKSNAVDVTGGLLFMSGYMTETPLPDTIRIRSVFFRMSTAAEAGTEVQLKTDTEESESFIRYAPAAAYDAVCIAYEGLSARESYVLSCGETSTAAFTPETVLTTASLPVTQRSSGFGGPSGGMRPS